MEHALRNTATELIPVKGKQKELLDKYSLESNNIIIDITITSIEDEPVPIYAVSIANIKASPSGPPVTKFSCWPRTRGPPNREARP